MAVFNLNDDITLAYLLKKTEEKASAALNKAVETINATIATIQTAVNNKVSKSGDTMTGTLHIRGNFVSNGTYTANKYSDNIDLDDSAGMNIGMLRSIHYSGGNEVTELFERRKVNGTDVYNVLQLIIKSDGTRQVYVSDGALWRSAIGAVNKAGDTMTADLTLQRSTTISANNPAALRFQTVQTDNNVTSSANISVYDDHDAASYGTNMVIQSYGNMIIGGGESPGTIYTNLYKDSQNENLVLTSDGSVEVYTNCQTYANRVRTVIDASGNFSGKAANVTGTVAIANGGSGQTGITTTTTVSSIITAASGITISSAEYCQWGKVAQLQITWKSSNTISVGADGNAADVTVGTVVSGKRPKIMSAGTSFGDNGGPAFYYLAGSGSLALGACGGTGATRTIAANTTFNCHITYLLP